MRRPREGPPRGSQRNTGNDCSRGRRTGRDAPPPNPIPEIIALSLLLQAAAWGWPGQCLDGLWPTGAGLEGEAGTLWNLLYNKSLMEKPAVSSSLYPEVAVLVAERRAGSLA